MLVLSQCDKNDVLQFARTLLSESRSQQYSFEGAAQYAVEKINDEFRLPDGSPLFAMLRIFRFSKLEDLHPELLPLTKPGVAHWLALMGSVGIEPAWNDRHQSEGHRAIPADNPATPMLKAAFHQIGLRFGAETEDELQTVQQERISQARYFHVPVALGSQYVPVQDGFVVDYDLQSVIGIGSRLGKDTSFMLIGFSLVPINQEEIVTFAEMNSFLGTTLSFHGAKKIWDD